MVYPHVNRALYKLTINVDKCSILKFGRNSNSNFIFTINGQPIRTKNSEKDLGIQIDKDLKYHDEASKKVQKAMVVSTS